MHEPDKNGFSTLWPTTLLRRTIPNTGAELRLKAEAARDDMPVDYYHNLHNHPHSYLSGTYYIKVPEQPAGFRSDLNPGAISFFDPRPQANMGAISGDGQIDPELRITPEPGLILLWPSFLHHLVHPNLSEDARVSVSFNVLLKNTERYLPS